MAANANAGNLRIPAIDPAQLGMVNPFAAPVDPPPSPSLGFQAWASDPRNAMKVTHAMTRPDAPLQPNAARSAASGAARPQVGASASPQIDTSALDAYERASAAGQQAGGSAGQQGGQQVAVPAIQQAGKPASQAGATRAMPAMPASYGAAQSRLDADVAEMERLKNSGPGVNKIKNPALRFLARAGDIAAPFVVGRGAMAIPGTTAHNMALQQQQAGRVGADQDAMQKELQGYLDQANLAHTQAETRAVPQQTAINRLKVDQSAAKAGLKVVQDEGGNLSFVPDENSPVYQKQQLDAAAITAHTDFLRAGVALRQAQAQVDATKSDPNSPAFKLAQQNLELRRAQLAATKERDDGYWLRALQGAYNRGLDGKTLPGAPVITDEAGNPTVVGTANATQAQKSQSNVAMLNEVEQATQAMRNTATALVRSGGQLNDARVAAAIADPKTTAGQWMQGQFANSGLSPQQRDYVIAVKAYRERLQPLRKSAGGSVSDSQVDRLMQMAPGAQTPDLDFLNRQLAQIDQLRTNLAQGVTTATGGLSVKGRPTAPAAAVGNIYKMPQRNYKMTANAPGGQRIGSNDGTTWFDLKTGRKVQ